jgi:hypothetical protein
VVQLAVNGRDQLAPLLQAGQNVAIQSLLWACPWAIW